MNHPAEAAIARTAAVAVVGEDRVLGDRKIMTMGGEDFSYFLNAKPGCFIFVGCTAEDATGMPHHHPSFDFDEGALAIGTTLWLRLVETILSTHEGNATPDE